MSCGETEKLYKECISLQLEESDLLSSIYSKPGELVYYDPSVLVDFNKFIDDQSNSLRLKLDFGVQLVFGNNEKIEVRFDLPHLYPIKEKASVTVRSGLLTKEKERRIKVKIEDFIDSVNNYEEVYVFQIISWLQDNLEDYMVLDDKLDSSESDDKKIVEFERLWIYSHHIKSKTKRKNIVQTANDLELSGFMRPGKPGVICVEGLKSNNLEFWKIIRSWNWQKITIRSNEVRSRVDPNNLESLRRWSGFREEMFDCDEDDVERPMNMALFLKYLEKHNSGYIKKDLFGIE